MGPGQGVAALIFHPSLAVAYGVTMGPEGRLFSWRQIDAELSTLVDIPSFGTIPCHLAVDPRGEFLVITNYGTGSITVFPLGPDGRPGPPAWLQTLTGRGPNAERQAHSHTHYAAFVDDDLLLITDLGGDTVAAFQLDRSTGRLTMINESRMPAGSGPRHLAFLSDDRVAISGELDNTAILGRLDRSSAAIEVLSVAPSSWRSEIRDDVTSSKASDIVGDPAGFYIANRGYNTVSAFTVQDDNLIPVDEYRVGSWPQHLDLQITELLVACQESDEVTVWDRNPDGSLTFNRGIPVTRPAWLTRTAN
jgi:6-phosphogluconolactonase (cycloisomerase 2 family)